MLLTLERGGRGSHGASLSSSIAPPYPTWNRGTVNRS
jgi:hypothetical protein